jgi:hypothetical protein
VECSAAKFNFQLAAAEVPGKIADRLENYLHEIARCADEEQAVSLATRRD